MNTYYERKRLQKAMRDFVIEQGADYFVTAAFNRNISRDNAQRKLYRWHAYIDKKLLGKNWCAAPPERRLKFAAFAEHLSSNLHWHIMVKLADADRADVFEHTASKCWKRCVESGDMDVQKLYEDFDVRKTCIYATKDIWQAANYDSITF